MTLLLRRHFGDTISILYCNVFEQVSNFIKAPWTLRNPVNRPWNPCPKFQPPFEVDTGDNWDTGPASFGYKVIWHAFRSQDPLAVAKALGVFTPKKSGWDTGLEYAYGHEVVFITPPVDGWVLAVGWGLPDMSNLEEDDRKDMETWSREFGEVQFF